VGVVALTKDLMDRSKLSAAIPGVSFTLTDDADVVIVDLGRGVEQVAAVRASHPNARIVAYGPHVENYDDVPADVVLPRSQFFRDPAAIVFGPFPAS
jgi:hypothetical protein